MASMIDLSGKKEQPWQYKVSAGVTQNIWDGGAFALGKKTAEAVAAKDEAELEARLIDGSFNFHLPAGEGLPAPERIQAESNYFYSLAKLEFKYLTKYC